jgi:hypothetical protein
MVKKCLVARYEVPGCMNFLFCFVLLRQVTSCSVIKIERAQRFSYVSYNYIDPLSSIVESLC